MTNTAETFGWPSEMVEEFNGAWGNGQVGHILVSETDDVRVWHLSLARGERVGFHHHVLNYFWSSVTSGRSRSHMDDGRVVDTNYVAGSTKHFHFAKGEYMIHDLENIGDTDLVFVTVEHLDSPNAPHPLGPEVPRLAEAA